MGGSLTGKLRRLLLRRIRLVMIAVALLAGLLVVATRLIDEGEVVKLTTQDADGRQYVTELWIVDLDESSYLRSGSPDAVWLARLRADPEIELQREGRDARYRAVPEEDAATLDRVNVAMSEKYGFADRLWGRISDRSDAVAIRLVPSGSAKTTSP